MIIGPGERAVVKIVTAGDEPALEEKVNDYLDSAKDMSLASIQVSQVQYHGRLGAVDFGFTAVLVMRIAK